MKKANREGWQAFRRDAESRSTAEAQQKTAETAADNAIISAELQRSLLLRLKRIEQKYPMDATEVRTRQGNSTAVFRIRDLTGAYRDITGDMPKADADRNGPIFELLRRLDDECGV